MTRPTDDKLEAVERPIRFRPVLSVDSRVGMRMDLNGGYIRYEDYKALSADRDALKAELAEAVGVLKDMRDDKIGHRHAVHFRRRVAAFLARHKKEAGA